MSAVLRLRLSGSNTDDSKTLCDVGAVLREGSHASIRHGSIGDQPVAVKQISKAVVEQEDLGDALQVEVACARHLPPHPNVLQAIDVVASSTHYFFILPLARGGDLHDFLVAQPKYKLAEERAVAVARDMMLALQHCHAHNVVHRDLKPENFLLDGDGRVLLADFGLAAMPSLGSTTLATDDSTPPVTTPFHSGTVAAPSGPVCKTMCGTREFVAPEVTSGTRYLGKPADVWSLGVCLYVCLTGRHPFSRHALKNLGRAARSGLSNVSVAPRFPSCVSDVAKDLLSSVFKLNPLERPTVDELLTHPWITSQSPVVSTPVSPPVAADATPDTPPVVTESATGTTTTTTPVVVTTPTTPTRPSLTTGASSSSVLSTGSRTTSGDGASPTSTSGLSSSATSTAMSTPPSVPHRPSACPRTTRPAFRSPYATPASTPFATPLTSPTGTPTTLSPSSSFRSGTSLDAARSPVSSTSPRCRVVGRAGRKPHGIIPRGALTALSGEKFEVTVLLEEDEENRSPMSPTPPPASSPAAGSGTAKTPMPPPFKPPSSLSSSSPAAGSPHRPGRVVVTRGTAPPMGSPTSSSACSVTITKLALGSSSPSSSSSSPARPVDSPTPAVKFPPLHPPKAVADTRVATPTHAP